MGLAGQRSGWRQGWRWMTAVVLYSKAHPLQPQFRPLLSMLTCVCKSVGTGPSSPIGLAGACLGARGKSPHALLCAAAASSMALGCSLLCWPY